MSSRWCESAFNSGLLFETKIWRLHNLTASTGEAMVVSLGPDAISIYALLSDLCQDPPSGVLLH